MITSTKSNKVKRWFKIIRKKYVFNPVLDIPWTPSRFNRNLDKIEKFPWNLKNEGVAIDLTIDKPRKLHPLCKLFKITKNPNNQYYIEDMNITYPDTSRAHLSAALFLSNNHMESAKFILEIRLLLLSEQEEKEKEKEREKEKEKERKKEKEKEKKVINKNEAKHFQPLNLSGDYPTSTQEEEPQRSKINIISDEVISSATTLEYIKAYLKTLISVNDTKENSSIKIHITNNDDIKSYIKSLFDLSSQITSNSVNRNQEKTSSITEDIKAYPEAVTGQTNKPASTSEEEEDVDVCIDLTNKKSDESLQVLEATSVSNIEIDNDTLANVSETLIPSIATGTNSQENADEIIKLRNYRKDNKILPNRNECSSGPNGDNINSMTEILKPQNNVDVSQIPNTDMSKNHRTTHTSKELLPIQKEITVPHCPTTNNNVHVSHIPDTDMLKNHRTTHTSKELSPIHKEITIPHSRKTDRNTKTNVVNNNNIKITRYKYDDNRPAISYDDVMAYIPQATLIKFQEDGIDIQHSIFDAMAKSNGPYVNQNGLRTNTADAQIGENITRSIQNNNNTNVNASRQILNTHGHIKTQNGEDLNKVGNIATITSTSNMDSIIPRNVSVHKNVERMENINNIADNTRLPLPGNVFQNDPYATMEVRNYIAAIQNTYENPNNYINEYLKVNMVNTMSEQAVQTSWAALSQHHNPYIPINARQAIVANKPNQIRTNVQKKVSPLFNENQIMQTQKYVDDVSKNLPYMSRNPICMPRNPLIVPVNPGVQNNGYENMPAYLIPKNPNLFLNPNMLPQTHPYLNGPQAYFSNNGQIIPPHFQGAYGQNFPFNNSQSTSKKLKGTKPRPVNTNTDLKNIPGSQQRINPSGVIVSGAERGSCKKRYDNINFPLHYRNQIVSNINPIYTNTLGNLNDTQSQYRQRTDATKMYDIPPTRQNLQIPSDIRSSVQENNRPMLPTYEAAIRNSNLKNISNNKAHRNRTDNYRTTYGSRKLPVNEPISPSNTLLHRDRNNQVKLMVEHRDCENPATRLSIITHTEQENRLAPCVDGKTVLSGNANRLVERSTLPADDSSKKTKSFKGDTNKNDPQSSELSPIINVGDNNDLANKPPFLNLKEISISSIEVDSHRSLRDYEAHNKANLIRLPKELHSQRPYISKALDSSVPDLAQPHHSSRNIFKGTSNGVVYSPDQLIKSFQASPSSRNISNNDAKTISTSINISTVAENDKKNKSEPRKRTREIETISLFENNPKRIKTQIRDNGEETINNGQSSGSSLPIMSSEHNSSKNKVTNNCTFESRSIDQNVTTSHVQYDQKDKDSNVASGNTTKDNTAMLALRDNFIRRGVLSDADGIENDNSLADAMNDTCSSLLFLMNNFERFKSLLNNHAGKYLKHKFVLSNTASSSKSPRRLLNNTSNKTSPTRLNSSDFAQDKYSSPQSLSEIIDVTENCDSFDQNIMYLLSGTLQCIEYREDYPCVSIQECNNESSYNASNDIQSYDNRILITLSIADDIRKWVEIIRLNSETATLRIDHINNMKDQNDYHDIEQQNDVEEESVKIQHTHPQYKITQPVDLNKKIEFNYNSTNASVNRQYLQNISNKDNPRSFGKETPSRSGSAIPEHSINKSFFSRDCVQLEVTASGSEPSRTEASRNQTLPSSGISERFRNKTAFSSVSNAMRQSPKNQTSFVSGLAASKRCIDETSSNSVPVITHSKNKTSFSSDPSLTANLRNQSFSGSAVSITSSNEASSRVVPVTNERFRNETASSSGNTYYSSTAERSKNQTLFISGPEVSESSRSHTSVLVKPERLRNQTSSNSDSSITESSSNETSVNCDQATPKRFKKETSVSSNLAQIERSREVTSFSFVSDFSKSGMHSDKSIRPSKSNECEGATLQPSDSSGSNRDAFTRNNSVPSSKHIKMLITKENKKYCVKLL